jgi:hypothetical protein
VKGFGDGSVLASDRDLEPMWSIAAAQGVLVIDGVFLNRDRQRDYWTFSIFLEDSVSRSVVAGRTARDDVPVDSRILASPAISVLNASTWPHAIQLAEPGWSSTH